MICLISQAFVTARGRVFFRTTQASLLILGYPVGNATIGTLWFGIILQLGVILSIIFSFLGNTLFQYGITIAIIAALATSFGAQGVHLNVFDGTAAQKAVSAGWIITCIVNVVWIIILSSEPSSFIFLYVANNGRVRTHPMHANGVQNVSTNLDAFAQKYTTGVPSEHQQQPGAAPGSVVGSAAGSGGMRMSGVRGSLGGDPETHRRRSAGVWGTPPQSPGGAGSMRDVPPVPEGPAAELSDLGAGTRATSDSNVDPNRPASVTHTTTDVTPVPQPLPRALALFDCEFVVMMIGDLSVLIFLCLSRYCIAC